MATVAPTPDRQGTVHHWLVGLDGLKGLAILMVMAFHMFLYFPDSNLVDGIVLRLARLGWCGVSLFFVLAGFLTTNALLDARRGGVKALRVFYARRALRILPLYYAIVFLSFIILPHFDHAKAEKFAQVEGSEIWYWLCLSNLSIAWAQAWRHGILDIAWFLAVLVQFYLLWPLFVFRLRGRVLQRICIGAALFSGIFRTALVVADAHPVSVYVLTPSWLDALSVGAWIALHRNERGGSLAHLVPSARRLAMAAGLGVLLLWLLQKDHNSYFSPAFQSLGYTLVALFFGALLVLVAGARPGDLLDRAFRCPGLRTMGKYSLGLYLLHLPLRALIRDTLYGPEQFLTFFGSRLPGQLLFFAGCSILSLGAAWLSWHLYEKHFLKLRAFLAHDRIRWPGAANS